MTDWLSDQWKQIRGHVKYEMLRLAIGALVGSGIIAALVAFLQKTFHGVSAAWFIFGSIFLCCLLVFLVALLGVRRTLAAARREIEALEAEKDAFTDKLFDELSKGDRLSPEDATKDDQSHISLG
jgi:phosphate/sulfate permease